MMMEQRIIQNVLYFNEVEHLVKRGLKVVLTVKGGSMRPFLRDGDKVRVASVGAGEPVRGDIVLAHTVYGVYLHRVIRVVRDTLVLSGDANACQLEYISRADVIGKVDKAWRKERPLPLHSCKMRLCICVWRLLRPFRGYLLNIFASCDRNEK